MKDRNLTISFDTTYLIIIFFAYVLLFGVSDISHFYAWFVAAVLPGLAAIILASTLINPKIESVTIPKPSLLSFLEPLVIVIATGIFLYIYGFTHQFATFTIIEILVLGMHCTYAIRYANSS